MREILQAKTEYSNQVGKRASREGLDLKSLSWKREIINTPHEGGRCIIKISQAMCVFYSKKHKIF